LKLTADRPFADPEAAAQRILQIAKQVEPVMKGQIYIELINGSFLFRDRGSPAEYGAGLKLLIERKELMTHDSGTFVWLPDAEPTLLGDRKQAKSA
jgi:hypothetical protein